MASDGNTTKLDEQSELQRLFDETFYLDSYPDVAKADVDPLDHYLTNGWREGRDPSATFSTNFYLGNNLGAAASGTNPLLHYIREGRFEGLATQPDETSGENSDNQLSHQELQLVREAFDDRHYLTSYPDVAESGQDPLEHYLRHGSDEGRDPSPHFSTSYYRQTNPDIVAAGVNPFIHFVMQGKGEGRLGRAPGGWRIEALMRANVNLKEQSTIDLAAAPQLETAEIRTAMAERRRSGHLVIALAHSDHTSVPGGIQLCMELEEKLAEDNGFDYLAIRPVRALSTLAEEHDPLVTLKLNGTDVATCRSTDLTAILSPQGGTLDLAAIDGSPPSGKNDDHDVLGQTTTVTVHCLLGHSPEALRGLRHLGQQLLWLHDFSSLCAGYNLLRNGVTVCGAPSTDSNACNICIYGFERDRHLRRIRDFFGDGPTTVVAPSESAATQWMSAPDRWTDEPPVILRHLELTPEPNDRLSRPAISRAEPVRIGFVGTPVAHKGWHEFVELSRIFEENDMIEFHAFGTSIPTHDTITAHPVHVRADDLHAVRNSLITHQVDAVIHWAIWPETFGFSACEALASGALLITNSNAGNIVTLAEQNGGLIFDNVAELERFLADDAGKLFDNRRSQGLKTYSFKTSKFSFELVKAGATA